MPKSTNYAIFWRFANEHDPNGWHPLGSKPATSWEQIEFLVPEGYKPGDIWREAPISPDDRLANEIEYKIMQQTVTVSDWRPHDGS